MARTHNDSSIPKFLVCPSRCSVFDDSLQSLVALKVKFVHHQTATTFLLIPRSLSGYLQHSFVSSLLNILRSAARTCKMYSAQTANNGSYRRDAKISWKFKLIQERLERIWIIEYTIQIVSENSETWYSVQTLDSIASLARRIAVLRTLPLNTEESLGVVIR